MPKAKDPFVPDDYEVSSGSANYMKFEEGANKFRILQAPLLGWVWWVTKDDEIRDTGSKPAEGDKPVRIKRGEEIPAEAKKPAKEFWAMPVWDYESKTIKLLEVTQKSILKTLVSYIRDEDWGSPLQYDIKVNRTGKGLDTEYEVMALPKKDITKEAQAALNQSTINLEALLEGGDVFGESEDEGKPEDDVEIENMA